MKTQLLTAAGILTVLALSVGEARAHGGDYRGPGGQVPPSGRIPGDPTPPPTPNPDGTTGGPYNGPGGPQTTPGPNVSPGPFSGIPTGTSASGPTNAGRGPGQTTPRQRRKSSLEGFERWEFWWGYNKDRFLRLKDRISKIGESTESADYYLGALDKNSVVDATPVTDNTVRETLIPVLMKALKDDFFDVRAAAVIALGKVGQRSEIPALLGMLQDENKQVRESSVLALGILGEPSAIPSLVQVLEDTNEGKKLLGRPNILDRTRAFAAIALGMIGRETAEAKPAVLTPLLAALDRREAGQDVPVCAISALGILGETDAIPRLIAFVQNETNDDFARTHAVIALGRLGDASVLPILHRVARRDRNANVRRSAIISLGLFDENDESMTFRLLAQEARKSRDLQSKHWALISLGRLGGEEARRILLDAVDREQKSTKAFAALGLAILHRGEGSSSDGRFIHEQFRQLKGDSTRAGLAIALGLMNYRAAKNDLAELMVGKGDPDLRGYCAVALGLMDARDMVSKMTDLLSTRIDPDFQRSAATALGLMGDRDVVERLTEILRTAKTEYEISSSAIALGTIGDHSAIAPLVQTIEGRHGVADLARANATTALGIVGDSRPLPPLHIFAADTNYRALVDSLNELLSIL